MLRCREMDLDQEHGRTVDMRKAVFLCVLSMATYLCIGSVPIPVKLDGFGASSCVFKALVLPMGTDSRK